MCLNTYRSLTKDLNHVKVKGLYIRKALRINSLYTAKIINLKIVYY